MLLSARFHIRNIDRYHSTLPHQGCHRTTCSCLCVVKTGYVQLPSIWTTTEGIEQTAENSKLCCSHRDWDSKVRSHYSCAHQSPLAPSQNAHTCTCTLQDTAACVPLSPWHGSTLSLWSDFPASSNSCITVCRCLPAMRTKDKYFVGWPGLLQGRSSAVECLTSY